MRIVSYGEYLYRFKDNGYYTEDIIPYITKSKENFKNYILEQECPIYIFKGFNDILTVLEALYDDQIITSTYINQCFEEIEINSTEVYKLLYKYSIAFQCRKKCTYFPFKLHIDVNMLKEKLKNAPSEFIVPNYSYNYSMLFMEKPDYDELINYSRFHKRKRWFYKHNRLQ
jgi:hypothetical protein